MALADNWLPAKQRVSEMITKLLLITIMFSLFLGNLTAAGETFPAGNRLTYPNLSNSLGPGQVVVDVGMGDIGAFFDSILPTSDSPSYTAVFPKCDGEAYGNCVMSIEYRPVGSKEWQLGEFSREKLPIVPGEVVTYANGKPSHFAGAIKEDVKQKIPAGDSSMLLKLPNAPHAGGIEYLVSVLYSTFPRGNLNLPIDFRVELLPVNYHPKKPKYSVVGGRMTPNAYMDFFEFPDDFEYRIKMKLGVIANRISTFFYGRINSPEIEIGGGILTISGKPEKFPIAQSKIISYFDLNQGQRKLFSGSEEDFKRGGVVNFIGGRGAQDFEDFVAWEPLITEIGKTSAWNIKSSFNVGDCRTSGVSGFVSSNAMLFNTSPPTWDESAQSLDYKIASTHIDTIGNLNRGDLHIILSKELVECLWGSSLKNFSKVEINVLDTEIAGTVQTNVVGEGGWVKIRVSDFSFSAPTLKVKLQFKESSQKSKIIKSKVMKCVKGKKVVVLPAKNAKCPRGYRLI